RVLGMKPGELSPGRVTYDLRRLRLHGLIERIPKTHSYRITPKGLRTAIFYTRLYNRSLRTGLAVISPDAVNANIPLARSIRAAASCPGDVVNATTRAHAGIVLQTRCTFPNAAYDSLAARSTLTGSATSQATPCTSSPKLRRVLTAVSNA